MLLLAARARALRARRRRCAPARAAAAGRRVDGPPRAGARCGSCCSRSRGRPAACVLSIVFFVLSVGIALFAIAYRATLERGELEQARYAVPAPYVLQESLEQLVSVQEAAPAARYAALGRTTPVLRDSGYVRRQRRRATSRCSRCLPQRCRTSTAGARTSPRRRRPSSRGSIARRTAPRCAASRLPPDATHLTRPARRRRRPARRRARRPRPSRRLHDALARPARPRAARADGRRAPRRARRPARRRAPVVPGDRRVRRGAQGERHRALGVRRGDGRAATRPPARRTTARCRRSRAWIGTGGVRNDKRRGALPAQPRGRLDPPAARAARGQHRPGDRIAGDRRSRGGPTGHCRCRSGTAPCWRRSSQSRATSRASTGSSSSPTCRRGSSPRTRPSRGRACRASSGSTRRRRLPRQLAQRPFSLLDVTSQRATLAQLRSDPLSRGALALLLVTGIVAAVLAAVGLLLTVVGDLRDESGELYDLEAQGATPRDLRRHVLLRASIVAVLGVAGRHRRRRDRQRARRLRRDRHRRRRRRAAAAAAHGRLAARSPGARGARGRVRCCDPARHAQCVRARLGLAVLGGNRVSAAVEAVDLFRIFSSPEGTSVALQGLTLDVEEGELIVVFGPSGSGKSTLLRILAGARPAVGGNRARARRGPPHAARTRARGVPLAHARLRRPALHARARARAHRASARRAAPRPARRSRAGERTVPRMRCSSASACSTAATPARRSSRAASSSGLRSAPRSSIVRASSSPTSRPASSMPPTQREIYELVRELSRDAGATTIVVSHDPESARVADRVVQIRDGRVSAESRAGEHAEAVVNRGGWIRLPEELVGDAARARLEPRARRDPRARRRARGAPAPAARRRAAAGGPSSPRPSSSRRCTGAARTRPRCSASSRSASRPAGCRAVTGPVGLGEVDAAPSARRARPSDRRRRRRRGHAALAARRDRPGASSAATASGSSRRAPTSFRSSPRRRASSSRWRCAASARGEAAERAAVSLAAVGLAELAGQRVARLSMGERQRVALARALVGAAGAAARRRADRAPRRGERTRRRRALRRARARARALRSSARRTIRCSSSTPRARSSLGTVAA